MNREIKFRAWENKLKTYYYSNDEAYFLKHVDGKLGLYENVGFYRNEDQGSHLISEDLEQYIGEKDKNGVEIYEGDIVKNYDEVGIVTFNTNNYADLPAFHLCDKNGESIEYYYGATPSRNDGDSEILGNIHENPELL